MRIKYGSTRVVILVGTSAIKVSRIRILRLVLRLLVGSFTLKQRKRFYTKYGSTFAAACRNYILAGILANGNEFSYYQASRDERVMPTLRRYLGGLISIQVRGEPISALELAAANPFAGDQTEGLVTEITDAHQYCRHPNGQVVLVDYGQFKIENVSASVSVPMSAA